MARAAAPSAVCLPALSGVDRPGKAAQLAQLPFFCASPAAVLLPLAQQARRTNKSAFLPGQFHWSIKTVARWPTAEGREKSRYGSGRSRPQKRKKERGRGLLTAAGFLFPRRKKGNSFFACRQRNNIMEQERGKKEYHNMLLLYTYVEKERQYNAHGRWRSRKINKKRRKELVALGKAKKEADSVRVRLFVFPKALFFNFLCFETRA